jgi:PAS domain S-box-containing protein
VAGGLFDRIGKDLGAADVSYSAQSEVTTGEVVPDAVLRAVIETSDDAIFTCDLAARIATWGAVAERLFGCAAVAVLGRPLETVFPDHLRAEVRAVIATVLAGDWIRHFETEVLRPDGMPTPVSLSLAPVFDIAGRPAGALVIARDVTEQHLAQAMLAEVEARLEEGEAMAHIGSWLWDLRTGAVQWSAEFHRIHGIDPLEFDGTFESHLEMIHADDRGRLKTSMEQSVASGRPFESEYRVVRRDGQIRNVHVRAQPTIGSSGKAVGLRGIGQDAT